MTAIDHEFEYNNKLRIPEYPDIVARWRSASAAERATARAALDQPYGPGERQRYDLFFSGDPAAPLVVFIHGGYWQLSGREDVSFVAHALTAAGIDVAIPSYTLCPESSILGIILEMRNFLVALWHATGKRPLVTGHSAGGHLTAVLITYNWGGMPGVPADLARFGVAISGVFDLIPLISTSMNRALRLSDRFALNLSPLRWPPPRGGTLIAAVGAEESGEFHRQSRAMVEAWGAGGVITEYVSIPGVNHFTILDELTRPGPLFDRVVALARRDPGAP